MLRRVNPQLQEMGSLLRGLRPRYPCARPSWVPQPWARHASPLRAVCSSPLSRAAGEGPGEEASPRPPTSRLSNWALGTAHWALGTGHWALGTGHWALGTGHWALGTGHWALGTGHWALGTGHWALGTSLQ